jgi:hypothetical protein
MRSSRVRPTGISTPLGGISWETRPNVDAQVLNHLVAYMEDRRVLYNPMETELREECVRSVLDMRAHLVGWIGQLPPTSELGMALRKMAAACRRFLDRLPHSAGRHYSPGFGSSVADTVFDQALGELRGRIGEYLGALVDRHKLTITDPLASILPPPPEA